MTKSCSKCKIEKDYSEFGNHPQATGGKQPCCRTCCRIADRLRWQDPERRKQAKNNILKRKYGIDQAAFDVMLASQGNVCAICKRSESEVSPNNGQPWQVDHCHRTGKVRGILCTECNLAMGLFHDNAKALSNAIQYLSL